MIELRRLHRNFGRTRAVNDISFEVPRGTVLGYVGPNGAGKTTSMRILATLDVPTYGDAFVDGFSVINDPDRVRRRLGFMPDYFGTYSDVNCWEYLDFFARAYGLVGPERSRAIRDVMAFTRLDGLRDKPIRGLSKGMKQRLCLGRSMLHDPSVLIMDEPAAGLDPRARIELREMIRALSARGKTILISSHILTELAEMCDQVAIIELGRLIAIGTVQHIMRQRSSHREVKVRSLDPLESLMNWLAGKEREESVFDLKCDGEVVRFSHRLSAEDEAGILRQMILDGIRISEFAGHVTSLEEVFLSVTQGEVQ
ncbi:MAG: ABC transporter ATP-binding protein [Planctomycetes bacterium]|nr:ABC transporter ATP-binding protein [Planctomycetota bacterium]